MADAHKCCKRVALASMVAFGFQEGSNKLRSIRNEMFRMLKDRSNCENSVFSDIGMTVLQTSSSWCEEWFDQLSFSKLA